jgi:hypothetical protein
VRAEESHASSPAQICRQIDLIGRIDFWIGGKETNWGIETWQLIFNGKEWKIMSALFSANDEHITPDPIQKNG